MQSPIFFIVVVFRLFTGLGIIFQICFGSSQRSEGGRSRKPHTATRAGAGIALVDLNAEMGGMLGVFWSESNHMVGCLS
jgi:hypothetical protein